MQQSLEWHQYRYRVRDIIIHVAILQFIVHILMHWNSYECGMDGNILMLFYSLILITRQQACHHGLKLVYGIANIALLAFTITFTYLLVDQSTDCPQFAIYIVITTLGYALVGRSIYRYSQKSIPENRKHKTMSTDL